ncbi:hypothetical protein F2P79_010243 [Pimephales promelas]|nr:hypothetical protein F2P79_010243 [Pimephales promelas]
MRGGRMQRSHKIKKMSKNQVNSDVDIGPDEDGDEGTASGNATEATVNQNTLLESLALLSKELKDFKQVVRQDPSDFKNDVMKTMKDDLVEFKTEVLRELQSQNANIIEAQTRIADLELACLEMKDTLITVVKRNSEMQDKLVDLESRFRRNNIRIYGVPEEKEGKSVTDFVSELFKTHLELPAEVELQVQQAHRTLVPKPATTAPPRSIIVNFLQFCVKEMVLQKAWQQKVEIVGKRVYFDNDYAADIIEKLKAYGPIKAALKERGIRFQTPYTKIDCGPKPVAGVAVPPVLALIAAHS